MSPLDFYLDDDDHSAREGTRNATNNAIGAVFKKQLLARIENNANLKYPFRVKKSRNVLCTRSFRYSPDEPQYRNTKRVVRISNQKKMSMDENFLFS